MAWYDSILKPLANQLAILMKSERTEYLQTGKAYYDGNQPKPLKVLPGKPDDNVLLNFTGLVVERSVSMLVGGGVKFDYDEEESTEAETLRKIWDVNKMDLLMHETGTDGAIYGTFYIRTDPLAITDPYTGEQYTELVLLDPELMEIEVSPRNMREVTKYIMQYKIDDTLYREEYYPKSNPDEGKGWVVDYYVAKGVWRLVKTIDWDYDFPPILHSKNLPSVHSVYGTSDIDDILGAQDTINFVASNIRKVIRNQAHKRLWGKGFNAESLEMGSDDMPILPNADAAINAIDATADMTSSEANFNTMRQSLFDIARVVDISSVSDKIGSLTNFGLRVLYSDALSKNATKRLLYGEALSELNRRLLVLEGYAGENTRPPQVVWGADLPQDEAEDAKLIHDDLNMGLVSKQTASKARGYQWDTDDHDEGEKDLIAAEGETSGRNTDVAMANFLRRGR